MSKSGFINGKALEKMEHIFSDGRYIQSHPNYDKFVKKVITDNKGNNLSDAKKIVENTIIPKIDEFLARAEAAGRSINDQAIFENF